MEILKAIILGIVEGLTEFLPVSSTGHLIIVNNWLSFDKAFTNIFDVVIQFGAILAVCVYFFKKIFPFYPGKTKDEKKDIWLMWLKVVIAMVPTVIIGVFLNDFLEENLTTTIVVAISLLIGGIVMLLIENNKKENKIKSISSMPLLTAFFVGIIQCIAMIPGVSRSAATIIGAMLLGLSRVDAAEFSFFLAIPTIAGASFYRLVKGLSGITAEQAGLLIIGSAVAFITALLVISVFMGYIKKHSFKPFGWYRIALGVLLIALYAVKII